MLAPSPGDLFVEELVDVEYEEMECSNVQELAEDVAETILLTQHELMWTEERVAPQLTVSPTAQATKAVVLMNSPSAAFAEASLLYADAATTQSPVSRRESKQDVMLVVPMQKRVSVSWTQ